MHEFVARNAKSVRETAPIGALNSESVPRSSGMFSSSELP